ncbi:MAG: peptidoglycan editing factor PgeF [Candidatus Binatus sp.]|jgi:YfiH family protein|uniref:peptidoglycan editing factor PgeF n=1 Tax=Candidatus Binatus sp. TaxID=2811406 RepID=UPI003C712DBA
MLSCNERTARRLAAERADVDIHIELSSESRVEILRAWPDVSICHGFIGRVGGVSTGAFAAMNLSYWVGDDERAVDTNWQRLRREVPALEIVARLNQVHGNVVHAATRDTAGLRPAGDGIVTAEPGVMLGIFTADCVPILMVDAKRRIAGALHAGWRGVIADIARVGVHAMVQLGARASDIRAAMGPSIGPCCFEVDAQLGERFGNEIEGARNHTRAGRPGKAFIDLRAIVHDQLERAGLAAANIASVGPCTRCGSDRFFSRRAAGGKTTGLQMSFVGFSA